MRLLGIIAAVLFAIGLSGGGADAQYIQQSGACLGALTGAVTTSAGSCVTTGTASGTDQAQPSNPTGTTSTSVYVMMGLAGSITPNSSGVVKITIGGDMYDATAADGGTIQIRYGTGTAPSNGGVSTGTTVGSSVSFIAGTVAERTPFALNGIVSGLAVGTAYWIDVAMKASAAATFTIENVSISAHEIAGGGAGASAVATVTASGISAAGTAQSTATALTTQWSVVSTVAAGQGVKLPAPTVGLPYKVVNAGANLLLVFPSSGVQINALGNNVAVGLAVGALLEISCSTTTQCYTQP